MWSFTLRPDIRRRITSSPTCEPRGTERSNSSLAEPRPTPHLKGPPHLVVAVSRAPYPSHGYRAGEHRAMLRNQTSLCLACADGARDRIRNLAVHVPFGRWLSRMLQPIGHLHHWWSPQHWRPGAAAAGRRARRVTSAPNAPCGNAAIGTGRANVHGSTRASNAARRGCPLES